MSYGLKKTFFASIIIVGRLGEAKLYNLLEKPRISGSKGT